MRGAIWGSGGINFVDGMTSNNISVPGEGVLWVSPMLPRANKNTRGRVQNILEDARYSSVLRVNFEGKGPK